MVLDVAPLEALLTRTFSIGLDVGRGREKVALVWLRLSKALLGAAETQAMAAEALAIERGVATEQIAAAEGPGAARRRVQRDAGPGAAPGRPRDGRGHRPGRARTPTRAPPAPTFRITAR